MPLDIKNGLTGKSFDGSLKFDCGDGRCYCPGRRRRQHRTTGTPIARLRLSPENLTKLLTGKLNPMSAVMMGKIKISGDMNVAMKLSKLIG